MICFTARILKLFANECVLLFKRRKKKMAKCTLHLPLAHSLLPFILEAKRQNKLGFNLLDKADLRFRDQHTTLDTLCVSLYMLLYITMLLTMYIIM